MGKGRGNPRLSRHRRISGDPLIFTLSKRSIDALAGVHPNLIKVVTRALARSSVDFKVIEGVRTKERQRQLYAQGRTNKRDGKGKPLPIVTWTLNSNHFVNPRTGYGHAVDILPAPYDWKDTAPFTAVAEAMFKASAELKVPIRWGADWDRDGKPRERGESDSPHFELA